MSDRIFVIGSAGEQPTALAYLINPAVCILPIRPSAGFIVSKSRVRMPLQKLIKGE